MGRLFISFLCVLIFLATIVRARAPLVLTNDDRQLVGVASFGFLPGGTLSLQMENLELTNQTSSGKLAFYVHKGHGASDAFETAWSAPAAPLKDCFLDNGFIQDELDDDLGLLFPLKEADTAWHTDITIRPGEQGVWQVVFVNCKQSLVSFTLTVTEVNPGNSHLSAGDAPLPVVYGLSSLAYIGMAAYWAYLLVYRKDTRVFRAHWLMLLLVVIIVVNKALQSAKFHYMNIGVLSEGWSISVYVFTSIRGLLSILIIVLLASGWMFIKPFLSAKDKTVISIVVPLQILANVAVAIRNEAAIGSSDWSFWSMLFPFVDLIACAIILWTILQTRKNLSTGTSADGKETDVLNKYKMWSAFYVVTLLYMYVTRIIVQLLQALLPFQFVTWAGESVYEAATILFYAYVGWKFRPYANNPYMQVATDDDDDTSSDTFRLQSIVTRHD
ncbi:lung seven transmembrane receptor-domain-containing protein [Gongronella butleri]|nr:lung seven transmembrane receptor-domain-containing protein [Gongronella butleri]